VVEGRTQKSGMFWRSKSSRRADAAIREWAAALSHFFSQTAAGGFAIAGLAEAPGMNVAGLPFPVLVSAKFSSFVARSAHSGRGADRSQEKDADGGNLEPERVDEAQPSAPDGVPEDMATMVLDNPALVTGSALGPNSTPDAGLGLRNDVDPASDAAVMLRVAAGDEGSFNFLAQKYHRPMIHFLYRMVHNQAVAEELAQEVFLRVYRARDSYRAEARFTTWLYRIATNLAVNHARDTRHERTAQTVYLDAPDEETGTTPDLADSEPTVEQRLLRDERMAAIRSHVMALPERQRMAVLMHKYQGMDYRQIGDVLKLSESATKSLLFRAYQTLRDKLKDFV
jgi:RNA polymerase sigma-70 factor (ECF subfamily)